METDFDVLVIGGGLVGLTGALACAQVGLSVGVVDMTKPAEQLETHHDGRASAIATASFRMIRALGVADALAQGQNTHAGPINKILISDGQAGETPSPLTLFFDSTQIAKTNNGEPLGYMVENRRMRHALHTVTKSKSNIEWIAPMQVASFETKPAHICVHFEDGSQKTAKLLVGADGCNSFVRRSAGIGVTAWPCKQKAIVTTVAHDRPHGGIAHELFLPSGPFAILPLTGNRANIVWTETPRAADAAMALPDDLFHAELARRFGDFLGEVRPVSKRWAYPLSFQHAKTYTAARVAIIGDAAHAIHPIAGQGLNMGLRDVAALAEVLAQAKPEGRDIGSALTLSAFEDWRKFDNTLLTFSFDVFNRLFSNASPPLRHARRLGLGLVDKIAPARSLFMKEASGQIGTLPPLLRGESYS